MKILKCLIFIASIFTLFSCGTTYNASRGVSESNHYIVISKEAMTLTLYDAEGASIMSVGMACGSAYGNKVRPGDMKTPEGDFFVSEICDASLWTHDFGDGRGEIKGAYGSHFIRLETPPHRGIGIHGTHAPKSIGTRASEGCVRIKNRHLRRLVPYIYLGMPVTILSSLRDAEEE